MNGIRRLGARFSIMAAPKNGASITGVSSRWLLTAAQYDSPNVPAKTNGSHGTWQTTYQQPTRQRPYLWRYDIYTMSYGEQKESDPWLAEVFGKAVIRTTKWENGKQFYAGNRGEPYLDIVVFTDGRQYECIETHLSSNGSNNSTDNRPTAGSTNQWWRLGDQRKFVSTELLLAAQALIDLAQTNNIRVMQQDGTTVAAALGGGQYPLWVGAPLPDNAPFRVSIDGIMHARNGFFTGYVRKVQTVITDSNKAGYVATGEGWPWLDATTSTLATAASPAGSAAEVTTVFSLHKCGSCIIFNGVDFENVCETGDYGFLHLPFLHPYNGNTFDSEFLTGGRTAADLAAEKARVRSYVGCSIEIYNVSDGVTGQDMRICGLMGSIGGSTVLSPWDFAYLPPGRMLRATCKRRNGDANGSNSEFSMTNERIYWEVETVLWGFTPADLGL